MRKRLPPVVFGDGTHTRDYVWVGDVAKAFVAALTGRVGTYNVGTGVETRTIDIFTTLCSILKARLKPSFAPVIPGEVRRNALECTLARNQLRWSPKVGLSLGLKQLARVVRKTDVRKVSVFAHDILSLTRR
jgi:UDP-glucose 4-epimerase